MLMVKILDFNCVGTVDKRLLCICFLWFTFAWIFTRSMFSIKLPRNIEDLKSYLKNIEMYWCCSWTLKVCCYVLVHVVQYFCQWLRYDNLWKIRTVWEPHQPELWKTTLKHNNLLSPASKILGSYMWVFTVLHSTKGKCFTLARTA